MSTSKRAAVVGVLAVLLVSGGVVIHRGSPSYALSQIVSAIEDRNRLRFQAHVDLDRALPATVDQLMASTLLSSVGEASGLETLGTLIGVAVVDQVKPAMIQAMRTSILESVESGSFDSLFAGASGEDLNLDAVGRTAGISASGFAGLKDISREGDVALAGLRFEQPLLDTTLVLNLRMERIDGRWMVVGPENLDSFVQLLEELRDARLTELNETESDRVTQYVAIGPLTRTAESFLGYTMIRISRSVENISDLPIRLSYAWLDIPDDEGGTDNELMLADRDQLLPGESTSLSARLSDLAASTIPSAVLAGDMASLGFRLSFVAGDDDEAEFIGSYSSWQEYERRLQDPRAVAKAMLSTAVRSGDQDPVASSIDRAAAGPWVVSEATNPLDDTPIVTLINESTSGRSRFGRAPSLVLRCRDNRTEVYINWGDYLGSESSIMVSYRVGDAPMQRSAWGLSTDNRATFFSGSHISLIKAMAEAPRFVAQVTPYSESPVTAEFDLANLSEKVVPLRTACGWE